MLHLALVLVLAALLMPMHLGEFGLLEFQTELQPEQAPLETFSMAAEEGDDPLVSDLDEAILELADQTLLAVAEPGAGGRRGTGSNGSQEASAGRRGQGRGRSGGHAEFFGTVAPGDRFVYVLDISGSMNNGARGRPIKGCRFQRACAELLESIDQLREDQYFYVVLFSFKTLRMFDDDSPLPQLAPATYENKQRLKDWLADVVLGGGTDPREALRLGLQLEPSAIFLLSDGEFNGQKEPSRNGVFTGNQDVFEVVQQNNAARMPIHTFAYEDPQGCDNMYDLSTQTDGLYRFIPRGAGSTSGTRRDRATGRATPIVLRTSPEERAESLYRLARVLETSGHRQEAIARYEKILRDYPNTDAADEARQRIERRE